MFGIIDMYWSASSLYSSYILNIASASVLNKCGIKTAIKCYEDPKYFEERLKKETKGNFKKEKELIYIFIT